MARSFALLLSSLFYAIGPAETDAGVPSSSEVYAALPSLEGARLTAFQAGILTRTQRELVQRNPSKIVKVEELLTKYNMCFRDVAKASVEARYREVVASLSGQERQKVLPHLQGPLSAKLLAFHEGSYPRLELGSNELSQLKAVPPAIDRFHALVRDRLRGIKLAQPGPGCQDAMARDFSANGLTFVVLPLRPLPGGLGVEKDNPSHYVERGDRSTIEDEPRPARPKIEQTDPR